DQYGQINVGDSATIQADSFPGDIFQGTVRRIADQAEFTPRNVQTAEGRATTVYAVEILVTDEAGRLKPGMPVDATFAEGGQ
ncbi:MAG: HlyD family efflux transporter periplasmic adaptor subunit, partial [Anaerolineales bacterium]|nr:HlyD family efflux transporter periplasmic adaptor subunit [Anaerolineales bacterium]